RAAGFAAEEFFERPVDDDPVGRSFGAAALTEAPAFDATGAGAGRDRQRGGQFDAVGVARFRRFAGGVGDPERGQRPVADAGAAEAGGAVGSPSGGEIVGLEVVGEERFGGREGADDGGPRGRQVDRGGAVVA